jgi:hypothetical protein
MTKGQDRGKTIAMAASILIGAAIASQLLTIGTYFLLFKIGRHWSGKIITPGLYMMGKYGQQGGHMPDIGLAIMDDDAVWFVLILLAVLWINRRLKKRKVEA